MLKAAKSGGRQTINLTISTDQTTVYNAFTQAGSPSGAVNLNITVNSSILVKAGLTITGFAAGSTANIINNGRIAGTPGNGAGAIYCGSIARNYFSGGFATPGGHAIFTTIPLTIDNTNGEIFGGGGGGGGGSDSDGNATPGATYTYTIGGGGGGGGQGYQIGANGVGGGGSTGISGSYPGNSGTAGSDTAAGAGGAGGLVVSPLERGGDGGAGGIWGTGGDNGGSGTYTPGAFGEQTAAAGGNAVKHTGTTCTITAGNTGAKVKGAVST